MNKLFRIAGYTTIGAIVFGGIVVIVAIDKRNEELTRIILAGLILLSMCFSIGFLFSKSNRDWLKKKLFKL